ncbi:MAG: tRNA pseudouridine(55) synthase TruB [Methylobacteriaceae bacterium]|jgi:tRNA pseudouridine55 synthase|nr:tRNA pseudouridine(55) synthase TruB [Methylobacteriaceae bacterium]
MKTEPVEPRPPKRDVHGWVVLDKPAGITSTHAVSVVRRAFRAKKAGHAGTLDPLASGVLPIALGEATKTVPYIVDGKKSYRFVVQWGAETDTDDAEGRVTAESANRPDKTDVEALLPEFSGTIEQIPPRFSAVKIQGERAYDLARDGQEVDLKPRLVDIERIALVEHKGECSVMEVDCGKGTYVRAIARDMGRRLGCYGHIAALRRTCVGVFDEERAVSVETVQEKGDETLLPVHAALEGLTMVQVLPAQSQRLAQGQPVILRGRDAPESGAVYAMFGGVLIAVGDVLNGELHPVRVFNLPR